MNKMTAQELKDLLEVEVYGSANNCHNIFSHVIKRWLLMRLKPSTRTIYLIRRMQYYYNSNNKLKKLYGLWLHNKIWKETSCYISPLAHIGKGLQLPHPIGIVIGGAAKIGENVRIYQNVTIGSRRRGDYESNRQPILEDGVTCYASSMVLGNVTLRKGSIVGASAIVLHSSKLNDILVGAPATSTCK